MRNKSFVVSSLRGIFVFLLCVTSAMAGSPRDQAEGLSESGPAAPGLNWVSDAGWVADLYPPVLLARADGKGSAHVLYHGADGQLYFLSADRPHGLLGPLPGVRRVPELISAVRHGKRIYVAWRETLLPATSAQPGIAGEKTDDLDAGLLLDAHRVVMRHTDDEGANWSEERVVIQAAQRSIRLFKLSVGPEGDPRFIYLSTADESQGLWIARQVDKGQEWMSRRVTPERPQGPESVVKELVSLFAVHSSGDSMEVYWAATQFTLGRPSKKDKIKASDNTGKDKALQVAGFRIFTTSSSDSGRSWTKPRLLAVPEQIATMEVLGQGQARVLLWLDQAAQRLADKDPVRKYTIRGLYSKAGKDWHRLPSPELNSSTLFMLRAALHAGGGEMLVIAGPRGYDGYSRDDIYALRFSFEDMQWSKPVRLTSNTRGLNTAHVPLLYYDGDRRVVALWQDYRDVRPRVYMNTSVDFGKTWLPHDVRLPLAVDQNTTSKGFVFAGQDAGAFYLVSHPDGQLRTKHIQVNQIPLEAEKLSAYSPEAVGGKQRLIERVEAFWKAKQDKDYQMQYDLLDPITRANAGPKRLRPQIDMEIEEFEVKEPKIIERFARVPTRVVSYYEKDAIRSGSKKTPPREDEVLTRWAWMDGDWYRIYDPQGKTAFINFYPY